MQMIVINGSGGCGKDTFIRQFTMCEEDEVVNISTVDPIKAIAYQVGWDGIKNERSRKFLSELKDLLINFNDLPLNYVRRVVDDCGSEVDFIFVHCREPKEIQKLVDEFNAKTLLISAALRVPEINSNDSDYSVNNYDYDYIVYNNGTLEDLNCRAKEFLRLLKGG